MKFLKSLLVLTVFTLLLSSCYRRHNYPVRGSGENVSEVRSAKGFDRICLSTDADVEFISDSVYFLELSGQANVLAVITTEVRERTLEIGTKGNLWDHNTVKVKVHSPLMRGMSISGSGDISSTTTFTTDVFDASISGSGEISLQGLSASAVTTKISGSGSVYYGSGSMQSASHTISGSGDILAFDNIANSATCRISGSGNMDIHVSDNLEATISGSGNIRYKGKPAVSLNSSGSGRIIHID